MYWNDCLIINSGSVILYRISEEWRYVNCGRMTYRSLRVLSWFKIIITMSQKDFIALLKLRPDSDYYHSVLKCNTRGLVLEDFSFGFCALDPQKTAKLLIILKSKLQERWGGFGFSAYMRGMVKLDVFNVRWTLSLGSDLLSFVFVRHNWSLLECFIVNSVCCYCLHCSTVTVRIKIADKRPGLRIPWYMGQSAVSL